MTVVNSALLGVEDQQTFLGALLASLKVTASFLNLEGSSVIHDIFKNAMEEREASENRALSKKLGKVSVSAKTREIVQMSEFADLTSLLIKSELPFFLIQVDGSFTKQRWLEKILRAASSSGRQLPAYDIQAAKIFLVNETDNDLLVNSLNPLICDLSPKAIYARAVMKYFCEDKDHHLLSTPYNIALEIFKTANTAHQLLQSHPMTTEAPIEQDTLQITRTIQEIIFKIRTANRSKWVRNRRSNSINSESTTERPFNTMPALQKYKSETDLDAYTTRRDISLSTPVSTFTYECNEFNLHGYPFAFGLFLKNLHILNALLNRTTGDLPSPFMNELELIIAIAEGLGINKETFLQPNEFEDVTFRSENELHKSVSEGLKLFTRTLDVKEQENFLGLVDTALMNQWKGKYDLTSHFWNHQKLIEEEKNRLYVKTSNVPHKERTQIQDVEIALAEEALNCTLEPFFLRRSNGTFTPNRWLETLLRETFSDGRGLSGDEIKRCRKALSEMDDYDILSRHLGTFEGQNKSIEGKYAGLVIGLINSQIKNELCDLGYSPEMTSDAMTPDQINKIPPEKLKLFVLNYFIEVFTQVQILKDVSLESLVAVESHLISAPPRFIHNKPKPIPHDTLMLLLSDLGAKVEVNGGKPIRPQTDRLKPRSFSLKNSVEIVIESSSEVDGSIMKSTRARGRMSPTSTFRVTQLAVINSSVEPQKTHSPTVALDSLSEEIEGGVEKIKDSVPTKTLNQLRSNVSTLSVVFKQHLTDKHKSMGDIEGQLKIFQLTQDALTKWIG